MLLLIVKMLWYLLGSYNKFSFVTKDIEREEMKIKREIKAAAKRGDMSSAKYVFYLTLRAFCPINYLVCVLTCRTLAREIVRSRKAKERLYNTKAQLNSVSLHLQQNLATYKLAGCIQKSAEVMKLMNNLIRLPQLNQVMMTMAREMEKAGLIEEMVDEIFEDEEEIEEAEEEVQKVSAKPACIIHLCFVLKQLTSFPIKVLDGLALDVITATPNAPEAIKRPVAEGQLEDEEEDIELKAMRERYAALKQGL